MAAPNTTLRAVRISMQMSQDRFAKAVQEAGNRIGVPNQCSKRLVQRWEAGQTSHPHPDHARALSGIWLSKYEYRSESRGAEYLGWHHIALVHTGSRLQGRSLANSSNSVLHLDLTVTGQVATGTWTEHTAADGYYSGAVYHGAIQLLADPTGRVLTGMWVGFGRVGHVNTGRWELTLRDKSLAKSALARWDHRPDEAGDCPPDQTRAPSAAE
jgi:transcriptional regulator with XRE-family HTH domain